MVDGYTPPADKLGKGLKALRLAYGRRQVEMAMLAQVDRSYYSKAEKLLVPFPLHGAVRLSRHFAVDVRTIYEGDA